MRQGEVDLSPGLSIPPLAGAPASKSMAWSTSSATATSVGDQEAPSGSSSQTATRSQSFSEEGVASITPTACPSSFDMSSQPSTGWPSSSACCRHVSSASSYNWLPFSEPCSTSKSFMNLSRRHQSILSTTAISASVIPSHLFRLLVCTKSTAVLCALALLTLTIQIPVTEAALSQGSVALLKARAANEGDSMQSDNIKEVRPKADDHKLSARERVVNRGDVYTNNNNFKNKNQEDNVQNFKKINAQTHNDDTLLNGQDMANAQREQHGEQAELSHKEAHTRDPLQLLAAQQKQRAAEAAAQDAKRTAEIQQQIEDHEKHYAAQEQQREERERQRRVRERILAEHQREKDSQRNFGEPAQEPRMRKHEGVEISNNDLINKVAGNMIDKAVTRQPSGRDTRDGAVEEEASNYQAHPLRQENGTDQEKGPDESTGDKAFPVRSRQKVEVSINNDNGRLDEQARLFNYRSHREAEDADKADAKDSDDAFHPKRNTYPDIPIEPPKNPTPATLAPFPAKEEDNRNHGDNEISWNSQNNDNNFNNGFQNNNNNKPPQHMEPPIGGINLAWDWEDFSITFNNYGGAEMKVRRAPHPTTGEPWPMPQYYNTKPDRIFRVSRELRLVPTKVTCDILDEALGRHLQRILRGAVEDMYDNLQHAEGTNIDDPAPKYQKDQYINAPLISRVEVRVRDACPKYPTLESDESYDLVVKKSSKTLKTYIWANEVWGAMRGLETFGQLVWKGTDGHLYIKETVISDYPRFPHRGLHIDTSRHFLFKEILLDIIDSMEMNKLNVFHWHIVDDQSFPYESKVYPELSRKGAYHPTYVYTLEDIAEIIEYARLRGVRVMPEFDTPGHTYSWGLSRPELLTQCYSMDRIVKGYLGPIDPSKNATYRFLETLFEEIVDVFQDTYLHLGGDEVPLGCWQSNPEVMAFAGELAKQPKPTNHNLNNQQNYNNFAFSMWSDDIKRVYEYYENRLMKILTNIGKKRNKKIKYVMWQEVMNNNLQLPNDTIIQVWMGDMADVSRAISMGHQVLYSTCWYLDHIEYGTKWPKYYQCDPADNTYGYHIDESKVLGGEIAFWSEYFSNENLIPLMWPRASAGAERLWSNKEVKNLDKAAERLSEHRCRMIKRGINAGEISGPGYCLHAPPKRRVFNDTAGCKGGNCTSRAHNIVQIEDIELHLRQRGGSITDCGNMFTRSGSGMMAMLMVLVIVLGGTWACTLSHSRPQRSRLCRNRSILFAFVAVLLVYFLCYTTIWMRAFEFSGSFHKTVQEDSRGGGDQSRDMGEDS